MVNLDVADETIALPRDKPSAWRLASQRATLLTLALMALFGNAFASMLSIWLHSSVYHHGVFVAPISIWLIFQRKDWRAASPAADWFGVAVIAGAAALWLIGRAASVSLFGHVAVVLAIVGAVIAVFGRSLARSWAFPLAFLFFMVPFGEEATPTLQHWASIAVAGMLNFFGVETARDGFMLTTSAGRFEIAQSCAGLRFLLASAMISSIAAYLAFAGWKKRAGFFLAALSVAIAANWLRAAVMVLLATATDRRVGVGPEHVAFGWAIYGLLIVALILLAQRLRDPPRRQRILADATGHCPPPAHPMMAALTICALIALYDAAVVSAHRTVAVPQSLAPLASEGFTVATPSLDWRAFTEGADYQSLTGYRTADASVSVSLVYTVHDRSGAEIAGAGIRAADGTEWRRVALNKRRFDVGDQSLRVPLESLENSRGERIEVATLYWLGDRLYAQPVALKRDIALQKLAGKQAPGGALFVAAAAPEAAAIEAFLEAVETPASWRSRTDFQ